MIPTEQQWNAVLAVAAEEQIRNRVMLALAYDAALRREDLCSLRTADLDPAHRILRIRAETTKTVGTGGAVLGGDRCAVVELPGVPGHDQPGPKAVLPAISSGHNVGPRRASATPCS
ncbi:site-specific integrase [Actinomadura sp. KC06]|uniref:site-specific integrase n=1 Tax=Actinomadura sp. KC06 TaxID=2530369 RepID=UPI001A9E0B68|nr:site-specific integrase [Actinomadura sp. KC06]